MQDHLFPVVVSVLLCIASAIPHMSSALSTAKDKESQEDDMFDLPPITCDSKSPCTCDENDGRVNCDEIIWTTDDEEDPLYTPLRSPNLTVTKKGFEPKIVSFRHNDIARLEKGGILPGSEKTLEELDFSYNRIYEMNDFLFQAMTKLRILRFSHNHLKRLRRNSFKGPLWNVHQLYLDSNYFTEIPDIFEELPNLQKLVLDGNKKLKISKKRLSSQLNNLKMLSLDGCNLNKLDDDLFDDLTSLEQLSLRNNPFTEVPKALQDIPSLAWLDFSSTHISELQQSSFEHDKHLKHLLMENLTFLYIIHDCAFCGLEALEDIILSNATELYFIHESAFGWNRSDFKMPQLKSLDVEFGNLTHLPANLLDTNDLEMLKLGGNQWNCICDMVWIFDAGVQLDQGSKTPICAEPSALQGRSLLSLSAQEICPGRLRISRLILSLFVLVSASLIAILFYYIATNYRIRNVFYRPDMPHIAYSNLNRTEEEEHRRKSFADQSNAASTTPTAQPENV